MQTAAKLVLQTRGIGGVVQDHFETFVKYSSGFFRAERYLPPPEFTFLPKQVLVLEGESRTGKTTLAALLDPHISKVCSPSESNVWFDSYYEGSLTALIDDYSKSNRYRVGFFLELLDNRPFKVPYKGGFMQWHPSCIVITANQEPNAWYPEEDPRIRKALLNRLPYRACIEQPPGKEYQYPEPVEGYWLQHSVRATIGTRFSVPTTSTPVQVRQLLSLPPLCERPAPPVPVSKMCPAPKGPTRSRNKAAARTSGRLRRADGALARPISPSGGTRDDRRSGGTRSAEHDGTGPEGHDADASSDAPVLVERISEGQGKAPKRAKLMSSDTRMSGSSSDSSQSDSDSTSSFERRLYAALFEREGHS